MSNNEQWFWCAAHLMPTLATSGKSCALVGPYFTRDEAAEFGLDQNVAVKQYVKDAADRLTEQDNLLDMAEANLAELVARLAAVNAALDQYDKDAHPADPNVLFACVSAIAKALQK